MPASQSATVSLQLPPILRPLVGGQRQLEVQGATLGEIMEAVASQYPAMALHLFDEQHSIRHNIVFLHDQIVVRARDAMTHRVNAGDEIVMKNALAGG